MIDIQNNFRVTSEVEGRVAGVSGKEFLAKLEQEFEGLPDETKKPDHQTISQTIKDLESAVKEAGVVGRSEHAISWNQTKEKKVLMSLPVQLHGLRKERIRALPLND